MQETVLSQSISKINQNSLDGLENRNNTTNKILVYIVFKILDIPHILFFIFGTVWKDMFIFANTIYVKVSLLDMLWRLNTQMIVVNLCTNINERKVMNSGRLNVVRNKQLNEPISAEVMIQFSSV